jgi:hypothetical protein
MKNPHHDIEDKFSDVTDQLQLPDLRLRTERRAVVLAAFEQARAIANLRAERSRWPWGVALAAAVVIAALVCYALFVPHRGGKDRSTSTALAATDTPPAEHSALCELNVALAMANARTAAAERELAWLTAMRDEADGVKEPVAPTVQPVLQNQP